MAGWSKYLVNTLHSLHIKKKKKEQNIKLQTLQGKIKINCSFKEKSAVVLA